jgi:hypothetical protein
MLLLRGSQRQQQQPNRTTRHTSRRVIRAPKQEEVPRERHAEALKESVSIGTDMEPDWVSVVKDSNSTVTSVLMSGEPEFHARMEELVQVGAGCEQRCPGSTSCCCCDSVSQLTETSLAGNNQPA